MIRRRVVTSFLTRGGMFLILKRSRRVRTMRGLWSGVSGSMEGDELPLDRARIEIREEVGIAESNMILLRAAEPVLVSPASCNYTWEVFPFLFKAPYFEVTLNWENSAFRWIRADQLYRYKTVPDLCRVLKSLL